MNVAPTPPTPPRRSARVEVEDALYDLSSRIDHTYGELILAARDLADELFPSRDSRARTLLGLATLALLCGTIIAVTLIIVHGGRP